MNHIFPDITPEKNCKHIRNQAEKSVFESYLKLNFNFFFQCKFKAQFRFVVYIMNFTIFFVNFGSFLRLCDIVSNIITIFSGVQKYVLKDVIHMVILSIKKNQTFLFLENFVKERIVELLGGGCVINWARQSIFFYILQIIFLSLNI